VDAKGGVDILLPVHDINRVAFHDYSGFDTDFDADFYANDTD